ncbi:MAG TPA: hypothetical protein DCL48_15415 [Alphaproteobacteria bacterium]|nr:hypothetical protein [Alphaproteobacteria bacterium]
MAPVSPAAVEAESNSRSEADVLRSLSKRREALDQRERELSIREQTMAAAERRIEERVSELKAIEGRINALLGQREAAQDEQLASLVKMYESMKPGDAARIFEKLDHTVLLPVAAKMKPAKLGSVMALMDAVKAQDLTVMLAKRLDINKAQIDGLAQAAKSAAEPEGPTVPPAEPTPVPLPSPAPVAPAPAQPAAALQPDVLPEMPPPPAPAPLPAQAAPAAPATAQPQG